MMRYDRITLGSLDYCLYHYGNSKIRFRGPRPDFKRPYVVFLGSTETFGKFVPQPFSQMVCERLNMACANFSALNAGLEMYLRDPSVLQACAQARVTVIGICGAHNLSNRYYKVHPRRNDRFLSPSDMLRTIYRDVDFGDIHYTQHLLDTLAKGGPERFDLVETELKAAWTARMKTLLETIKGKKILLWMAHHAPPDAMDERPDDTLFQPPAFVDQPMMDEISGYASGVVECIANPQSLAQGTDGMVFAPGQEAAAAALPGPAFHAQAADQLGNVLRTLV
ncbi:MAG: DUF6473 family protein [Paracoccaceae bacterium]